MRVPKLRHCKVARSGRFDGRLITDLFLILIFVWPHYSYKLLDRRGSLRNSSPKFSYFCCVCYQIRSFGLLHVQDHKFVRSILSVRANWIQPPWRRRLNFPTKRQNGLRTLCRGTQRNASSINKLSAYILCCVYYQMATVRTNNRLREMKYFVLSRWRCYGTKVSFVTRYWYKSILHLQTALYRAMDGRAFYQNIWNLF